ncbi:MAG: hypothetical protein PUC30_13365 [Lachnospiraceae bacterium]|nr:hypothetical protein [Lachnospiraceae bacterium]
MTVIVIKMLVTVTVLNDLRNYVQEFSSSVEIVILGVAAYVSIGLLGIFVVYVRNVNIRLEEMLRYGESFAVHGVFGREAKYREIKGISHGNASADDTDSEKGLFHRKSNTGCAYQSLSFIGR